MSFTFGQVFLYLAGIFIINSLLINIVRCFKLADFTAHVLTGMLFALILLGWGKVFGPASVKTFEDNFRITGQALENLKSVELPDSLLGQLASMQDKMFIGEDFFVDSLSAKIGEVQTNLYKTSILKFTATSGGHFNDILHFLTQIGLLLLFVQLGFNFDWKLFSVSGSQGATFAVILFILNAIVFGGAIYLFFSKPVFLFSLYVIIAFVSISIGAVLAAKFPASLSVKKPLRNLVQAAVILDLAAIFLFTVVGLSIHYSEYSLLRLLEKDVLYWIILGIFAMMVFFPLKTEQFFQFLQKFAGISAIILKTGVFFLFIYAGFRVGLSVLLLGFWGGLLLKAFSATEHIEVSLKLFPIASFLYVIPFAEIGRDLAVTHWYSSDFGYYFLVLFSSLVIISLIAGLMVIRKKEFPLILSLGTFPRGEITVLILWLFKNMQLISSPIFVVAAIVVMVSNLLGYLLARLFFVHSVELQKRLRQR